LNDLQSLAALGFQLPTPAYLFGLFFFGISGYAVYRFGKKNQRVKAKWIGLTMMLYPYAISSTEWLYAIGIGLGIALYFLPEHQ
jgi:hypothetical protein